MRPRARGLRGLKDAGRSQEPRMQAGRKSEVRAGGLRDSSCGFSRRIEVELATGFKLIGVLGALRLLQLMRSSQVPSRDIPRARLDRRQAIDSSLRQGLAPKPLTHAIRAEHQIRRYSARFELERGHQLKSS